MCWCLVEGCFRGCDGMEAVLEMLWWQVVWWWWCCFGMSVLGHGGRIAFGGALHADCCGSRWGLRDHLGLGRGFTKVLDSHRESGGLVLWRIFVALRVPFVLGWLLWDGTYCPGSEYWDLALAIRRSTVRSGKGQASPTRDGYRRHWSLSSERERKWRTSAAYSFLLAIGVLDNCE